MEWKGKFEIKEFYFEEITMTFINFKQDYLTLLWEIRNFELIIDSC